MVGSRALSTGSSLEAVEAAVRYMEDSGAFNAGRGSVLTIDGRMQLDAAVMVGKGLKAGGVGACSCTHNAIALARFVMERTKHVLVVGEDCRSLALKAGLPLESLRPLPRVMKRFSGMRRRGPVGTVGAVAIDSNGVPASAVSTGGLWLKLPGRVGDSAIIGAGAYADGASGAASATGEGEEIMRMALTWEACRLMKIHDAMSAAELAIKNLTDARGIGLAGIITVDLKGRIGFAQNTRMLGLAYFEPKSQRPIVRVQ